MTIDLDQIINENPMLDSEALFNRKDLLESIMVEIDKLSDKLKIVAILRYYHEFDVSEIAYVLDIPEGTVKK